MRDETNLATEPETPSNERVGNVALWFGFFGGPIAWSAHLLVSYPLVPLVCANRWEWLLHLVTLVTVVVSLAAMLVAWQSWRELRGQAQGNGNNRVAERKRFMALAGVLISGMFLFAIVLEGLPPLLQDPCD